MSWLIRIDGNEVSSDDFLVDDLAWVEKQTGAFWSIANPWKDAKVAKAFARVALVRSGISEEDADERVESLTLRDIKAAFEFKDDSAAGSAPARAEGKGRKDRTSQPSSDGEPSSSTGRRKKSAASA